MTRLFAKNGVTFYSGGGLSQVYMKNLWFFPLFCLLLSCSTTKEEKPRVPIVQLNGKIHPFNHYTSRSQDFKQVMKGIVTVLQEEGFVVQTIEMQLGLITAKKEVDIEKAGDRTWAEFLDGQKGRWAKHRIIEIMIDVTKGKESIIVKSTFYVKDLDNRGGLLSFDPLDDPLLYRDFFTKIDKKMYPSRPALEKIDVGLELSDG